MKINIGCGFDKREGYVNIDIFPQCEPDLLMDIEITPWDIQSDSVDEILAKHVIEHVGQSPKGFISIMKEIYRILKGNGILYIMVPNFHHPNFHADPTHVRAFSRNTFHLFSKRLNRQWIANGENATMLALAADIDFEVEKVQENLDPRVIAAINRGEISADQAWASAHSTFGMIAEIEFVLRCVK